MFISSQPRHPDFSRSCTTADIYKQFVGVFGPEDDQSNEVYHARTPFHLVTEVIGSLTVRITAGRVSGMSIFRGARVALRQSQEDEGTSFAMQLDQPGIIEDRIAYEQDELWQIMPDGHRELMASSKYLFVHDTLQAVKPDNEAADAAAQAYLARLHEFGDPEFADLAMMDALKRLPLR